MRATEGKGQPERKSEWPPYAVLLLALLGSAGCSRASPFRSLEQSIRVELPRLIGPADRYEVVVSRSTAGLIGGRIPWIEIHGQNVRAIPGLNLDDLSLRLEGVRFNRADHTVREIEQSRFEAGIAAASIERALRSRSSRLRDARVSLLNDEIRVHVAPALLGLGVPIEVDGRPMLRGAAAIDFEVSRLSILRLGLREFVMRRLEGRLNPIVDLSTLSLPVHLSAVRINGDRVVVEGTTTLTPAQLKR